MRSFCQAKLLINNDHMSKYIDGFVLVVPKKNIDAYRRMAKSGAKMWRRHGALEYIEAMGDDLSPKMGGEPFLSFPKLVKLRKNETVWFSYIVYRSKAHRNQVNRKVFKEMSEMADKYKDMPMPFDIKRMAYGGFKASVAM